MSIRTEKVADLIRDEISDILRRRIHDERIGFVSITEVNVAPDLAEAFVYISVFGAAAAKKNALRGLQKAAGFIRSELSKKMTTRITPKLVFRLDESLERGDKIIQKLNALKKAEGK